MPTLPHLGVSRRIEDQVERERLRSILVSMEPKGGVIVRTAGEGATESSLRADVDYLHRLWQEIQRNYDKKTKPGLVHAELDVELRALRDLLNEDVDRVVTDDEESFRRVTGFIGQFMPKFKSKVSLYSSPRPLFDQYEIDIEISRSLERKIWLKSGGYIVVDEAEALVVIDVNTGRYVGKKDFEDTILKTNLEAVREIAHQLRIRNCGGIVIIDFIDMEKEAHREKVLAALREELQRDRARTAVVSMSNLGLVEMTRKRIRPSLVKTLCEPCSYCEGSGYIKQKATVAHEIFRDLEREGHVANPRATSVVHCHSDVGDYIYEEETEMLEDIERRIGRSVVLKLEPGYHREQYEIFTM
jgi:ribonuclease G